MPRSKKKKENTLENLENALNCLMGNRPTPCFRPHVLIQLQKIIGTSPKTF